MANLESLSRETKNHEKRFCLLFKRKIFKIHSYQSLEYIIGLSALGNVQLIFSVFEISEKFLDTLNLI
jgi:hypothetical protein